MSGVGLRAYVDLDGYPDVTRASCHQDPFPDRWVEASTVPAKDELRAICLGCEVRDDCLAFAQDSKQPYGIWGGMDDRQRDRIRRGRTTVEEEWGRYAKRKDTARRRKQEREREARRAAVPNTGRATTIAEKVAADHGYTLDQLRAADLRNEVCAARIAAMQAVRRETDLSYPAIGRIFNRDHSTVVAACSQEDPERCGTLAGWRRHQREEEPCCLACATSMAAEILAARRERQPA